MNIAIKQVENGIVVTVNKTIHVFEDMESFKSYVGTLPLFEIPKPKRSFSTIRVTSIPEGKKIPAIRIIREVTGLGLKEAKESTEDAALAKAYIHSFDRWTSS